MHGQKNIKFVKFLRNPLLFLLTYAG